MLQICSKYVQDFCQEDSQDFQANPCPRARRLRHSFRTDTMVIRSTPRMFLPVPVPTEYSWQQPHPTFRPHEHLLECSTTRSFVVMHGVLVQHKRIAIAFRQAAKFFSAAFVLLCLASGPPCTIAPSPPIAVFFLRLSSRLSCAG